MFEEVLDETWKSISEAYDVIAERPDLSCLFQDCNLTDPIDTSEGIILNMLVEITERIDRFSPWYTLPARAFGIMRMYAGNQVKRILSPDAVQRWQPQLGALTAAVRKHLAVLQAELLVDNLISTAQSDSSCVRAVCRCVPQRSILISRPVLNSTEILCSECNEIFRQVDWW